MLNNFSTSKHESTISPLLLKHFFTNYQLSFIFSVETKCEFYENDI